MKTVMIDGVSLTEEQVMQAYKKIQEPEFEYPMWFKHKHSTLVMRFNALDTATCVIAGDECIEGDSPAWCKPHTHTVWQQVEEPKKYERSYTGYAVFGHGRTGVSYNSEEHFNNFNVYATLELAKKASKLMRKSNKLIMACLLVDPDYEPDWSNTNMAKYSVYFNNSDDLYITSKVMRRSGYAAYVSTKEKAEEVCKLMDSWREL